MRRRSWHMGRRWCLGVMVALTVALPAGAVDFAPGASYDIPSPGAFGGSIEALQLVTARHQGNVVTFEGRLSITPQTLLLVSTDPSGRRLMTIEWRDGALAIERSPGVPEELKPENIIADITFMYWPEAAVARGLARSGATLSVTPRSRAINLAGRDIVTITYEIADPWGGVAFLRNHLWGYDIEVRSQVMSR